MSNVGEGWASWIGPEEPFSSTVGVGALAAVGLGVGSGAAIVTVGGFWGRGCGIGRDRMPMPTRRAMKKPMIFPKILRHPMLSSFRWSGFNFPNGQYASILPSMPPVWQGGRSRDPVGWAGQSHMHLSKREKL
jgi:hypothetical protein